MPRKKKQLINKLIPIPNDDKKFHERWNTKRNPLNIPHPFSCILSGGVNLGKTNTVKNIILRQDPPFKKIIVIHCDAEFTQEWFDCNPEMLSEIPHPTEWDASKKTLVVLDDIEYKGLNKQQQSNLDRLFGFCSTHKNISICATCQDFFNLPPSAKRMANVFVLWKSNDEDSFKMISRKTGMKMTHFMKIFEEFMHERRDSLWIDLTEKSPFPLRKNGFDIIKREKL